MRIMPEFSSSQLTEACPTTRCIGATVWRNAQPVMQCLDCGGPLTLSDNSTLGADGRFCCKGCERDYEIADGILIATAPISGNNRVAADFYNSPSWEKYRFWKRFTPFTETAVSKWRAEVFQHLTELEHTRLLDVAIGAGLTVPFAPDSCEIFGIDVSIQQLNDCKRDHAERGLKLVLGEAESLPFADNAFDNLLSFGAINYFNDPLKSLQEMVRVTKPGGRIVVTDENPDLPTRMIGHRIGWPALDRWILSRFLHLGDEFATLVNEHVDLKMGPIFDQVFETWESSECCNGVAYCVVGRASK